MAKHKVLMCTFRSVSDLLQHKLEIKSKMGKQLFANTLFLKNASTLEIAKIFVGAGQKFSAGGNRGQVPEEERAMASSRCLVENLH